MYLARRSVLNDHGRGVAVKRQSLKSGRVVICSTQTLQTVLAPSNPVRNGGWPGTQTGPNSI